MDYFLEEVSKCHGNGKHKANWATLKKLFSLYGHLIEQAAHHVSSPTPTAPACSLLLHHAHQFSSSFRASLIVVLMLMYQMDSLDENLHEVFVTEVTELFDYISPQEAACASEELAKLSHKVTELTCIYQCPAKVIPSLSRLSRTAAPSSSCLTAIHPDILQACIAGKMYSFAHDLISETKILEISPPQCHLDAEDFLKFFYYSGIVYISMKKFGKALECFNEVMSMPATLLSAICIDAFKKAIMVSLIERGEAYTIPSDASAAMKKFVKSQSEASLVEPYYVLQKHFLSGELTEAHLDTEEMAVVLSIDSNGGIARQTMEAQHTHRIIKISKAYMSISLEALAQLVGCDYTRESIEKKIIQMNNAGTLLAKINNSTGIVTFLDSSSRFQHSTDVIMRLNEQLETAFHLANKLRDLHKDVLTSPKFLKKQVASSSDREGTGVSLVDHGMEFYDTGVEH